MYLPDLDKIAWYFCAVNPEPWKVGPVGVNRRNGRLSAYVGRDEGLHAYEEAIKEELSAHDPAMIDADRIGLIFYFWRDIPYYETTRKTHKHEADLTNLQKATEDACQGILFENDKAVKRVVSHMVVQSSDVSRPGVLIGVHEIPADANLQPPAELGESAMKQLLEPSVPATAEDWKPPEGMF